MNPQVRYDDDDDDEGCSSAASCPESRCSSLGSSGVSLNLQDDPSTEELVSVFFLHLQSCLIEII